MQQLCESRAFPKLRSLKLWLPQNGLANTTSDSWMKLLRFWSKLERIDLRTRSIQPLVKALLSSEKLCPGLKKFRAQANLGSATEKLLERLFKARSQMGLNIVRTDENDLDL